MDWKIGYGPPYHTICYIYSTVGRSIADIYDPRRHIYLGASLRFSHKSGSNTETRQSSATKHAHTESTCTHSFTPHVGSLCMTGTVLQWQLFHLLVEVSVPVSLHVIVQSLHHPIQPFLFVLWISLLFSLSYTGPCTPFVSLYPLAALATSETPFALPLRCQWSCLISTCFASWVCLAGVSVLTPVLLSSVLTISPQHLHVLLYWQSLSQWSPHSLLRLFL